MMKKKMRVLILEDEIFIAAILESIVEDTVPAEVSVFDSVQAAEGSIGPDLDLALLDINLTNGKSYGLAKQLKNNRVPFIFISASPHADMPEELRGAPFIQKPFREEQIRAAVLDTK